jgi:hypothetical protein
MNLKTLIYSGLIFQTVFCFAQEQADTEAEISKGKTKLSGIASREGVIIAKKFEDIGAFTSKGLFYPGTGNLLVQFVTLSDAATNESRGGYLFSTNYVNGTYLQSFTSFVDIEELPDLVKFLDFIDTKITSPQKDIEYWFNSLDLSIAVYYQSATGKRAEKWSYLVRVERGFQRSTFNFNSAESFLEFSNKIRSDYRSRGHK